MSTAEAPAAGAALPAWSDSASTGRTGCPGRLARSPDLRRLGFPRPPPPAALAHRFAPEKVCLPARCPSAFVFSSPASPSARVALQTPAARRCGSACAADRARGAGPLRWAAGLQDVLALSRGPVLPKRFLRLRHRGRPSSGPSLGRARPAAPGAGGRRRPPRHRGVGEPRSGLPDPLRFLFFGTHGFWDEILFTFLGRQTGRPAATRRSGPPFCRAAAASWWRNSTSTCTGAAAGAPGSGARLRDLPLRVGAVPGPGPPLVRRLLLGLFSLPTQFHGPHHPDVFTWLDIPFFFFFFKSLLRFFFFFFFFFFFCVCVLRFLIFILEMIVFPMWI
uniref:Uncharacterized protein n=1 Tax=Canis lupus familiaris TaxID=9615 RepID=A0A8C0TR98_CANLF